MHDRRNRKVASNIIKTYTAILLVFILLTLGLDIQMRVFSRVGAKIWNEIPASLTELPKNASKRNSTLFLLIFNET